MTDSQFIRRHDITESRTSAQGRHFTFIAGCSHMAIVFSEVSSTSEQVIIELGRDIFEGNCLSCMVAT